MTKVFPLVATQPEYTVTLLEKKYLEPMGMAQYHSTKSTVYTAR